MSDRGASALHETTGNGVGSDVTPFVWSGSPWSLVGVSFLNAVLTVITVGLYNFWGRTEVRRRTWSCVRLCGEPFVYHGTATELLRGFVAAVLFILLPLFLLGVGLVISFGQASTGWVSYQVALLVVIYPVLKSFASYRARRYRLSRTSWRGVRGTVTGSAGEFAFLSWATSILTWPSVGWSEPWRVLYVQRFLIGDTMLGDRPLAMEATSGKLYLRFAVLWIGTIVILVAVFAGIGVVVGPDAAALRAPLLWARLSRWQLAEMAGVVFAGLFVWSILSATYYAGLYNLSVSTTVFKLAESETVSPPLKFKLATSTRGLIWLFISNLLITYGSLYVLKPVATARSLRYFVQNLSLIGSFDGAAIGRNPRALIAEGEGLAQAFDFDAF
jgi:uncharacterized membrane protein YjgN (DUF898 family)